MTQTRITKRELLAYALLCVVAIAATCLLSRIAGAQSTLPVIPPGSTPVTVTNPAALGVPSTASLWTPEVVMLMLTNAASIIIAILSYAKGQSSQTSAQAALTGVAANTATLTQHAAVIHATALAVPSTPQTAQAVAQLNQGAALLVQT